MVIRLAKTIILGIDGATFDVLDPLIEKDLLPNLASISKKGTRADLRSVYPPITAPAWTSLATGKNPGKTGVYDFRNRRDLDTYELKSINSQTFRRSTPFWDILNDGGKKIGIYNYPFLYPPYKINGFMTSGTGSGPEQDIAYPKELKSKLKEVSGGRYEIQIPYTHKKYKDNLNLFKKDAFHILKSNKAHLNYLLGKDMDMYTIVINVSDFAQHYMWGKIHEGPLADADNEHKKAFIEIWERIDELVGFIVDYFDDANVIAVSDHGFGPNKQTFYINSWLEENGFLKRKESSGTKAWFKIQKKLGNVIRFIGKYFPSLARRLWRQGEKRIKPFTEKIDFEETEIFAIPQSIDSGKLWVNPKIVDGSEIDDLLTRVEDELKSFFERKSMDVDIHRKEEIYEGDKLKFAPDLLFKVNDFECSVHFSFKDEDEDLLVNEPDDPNRSGAHKRNGIFIAHGPDIKEGVEMDVFDIYDVAPTILHMYNVPIPSDMDGRVLKEIFEEGSEFSKREIKKEKLSREKASLDKAIGQFKGTEKI